MDSRITDRAEQASVQLLVTGLVCPPGLRPLALGLTELRYSRHPQRVESVL